MAEEVEEVKSLTYHVQGNRANAATYTFYSAPFFPEIKEEADTIKVKFNEGYIYDHANMTTDDFEDKTSDNASIPRIKVEDLEHTHAEGEKVEYSIEIIRNEKTGEVVSAKIIRTDQKTNAETFRNFIVENELETPPQLLNPPNKTPEGKESFIYIDLADFKGFELKELYVRENIHVYYRGFEQLSDKDSDKVGSEEDPFPILLTTGTTGANGMIGVKALVEEKDRSDNVSDENILDITDDENQIYLFVPKFDDSFLQEQIDACATTAQLTALQASVTTSLAAMQAQIDDL